MSHDLRPLRFKTKDISQSCIGKGALWHGGTLDINDERINFLEEMVEGHGHNVHQCRGHSTWGKA